MQHKNNIAPLSVRIGRASKHEGTISIDGSDLEERMIGQVGGVELVPGEMRPNHNLRKLIGTAASPSPSPSPPRYHIRVYVLISNSNA